MTAPRPGDLVQSILHQYVGMVFLVHPNFYVIQDSMPNTDMDEWFKLQKPALHPALKKKPWVEVLLFQGEHSVLLPAGTVEVLVRFSRIKKLLAEFAEEAKKSK